MSTVEKRVLVTGAAGFVGRHCLTHLHKRGFEVHATSRRPEKSTEQVTWHCVDVFDPVATGSLVEEVGATHLLHVAWYVEHGKFWHSAENLRCVSGSLELVKSFYACGGSRALVVGTCYEYDIEAGWLSESLTARDPQTLYGIAKDSLHRLLQCHAQSMERSLAWGRIFFPFGPHEGKTRLVPSVIRSLLAGEDAKCSAGTQVRDFLHVEDVAGGLVALLASDVEGGVNICSGEPRSIASVVRELGTILQCSEQVKLGVLPMGKQPPFMVGDNRRLAQEVGWKPSHDLHARLEQTVDWWRSAQ